MITHNKLTRSPRAEPKEAERVADYLHASSHDILIAAIEEHTITCHIDAIFEGKRSRWRHFILYIHC